MSFSGAKYQQIVNPITGKFDEVATAEWIQYIADQVSSLLDASSIVSGVLDIARIPLTAIERAYIYGGLEVYPWNIGLTTLQVQNGDAVKMVNAKTFYIVIDDTQLNSSDGYAEYTASSDWSVVTNKPIVTSWSGTTLHSNIPSEKLTKDSLDGKSNTNHDHSGQQINPDVILLNKNYTDAEATLLSVGCLFYNSDQQDWLLKTSADTYYNIGGEVSPLMKNGDSFTHLNGQPVYVYSGNGKLPVTKLANASNELTSYTIALATQDVLHTGNSRGRYCTFGGVNAVPINNVIQTGESSTLWVEGAVLYLSTESGKLTTVRPTAPNHGVRVGYITDKSGSNISIFATVDVGSELSELHDVDITESKTTPLGIDSLLIQDTEDSNIWKKVLLSNLVSYFPSSSIYNYLFVSPNGNDTSGDGTMGKPYLTLEKAVSMASSGNVIYVMAGTYTPASNLAKAGVSWYFDYGTTINGNITLFNHDIIVDTTAVNIRGNANFVITGSGQIVKQDSNAIRYNYFECDTITSSGDLHVFDWAWYQITFKVNRIYHSGTVSFIRGNGISSATTISKLDILYASNTSANGYLWTTKANDNSAYELNIGKFSGTNFLAYIRNYSNSTIKGNINASGVTFNYLYCYSHLDINATFTSAGTSYIEMYTYSQIDWKGYINGGTFVITVGAGCQNGAINIFSSTYNVTWQYQGIAPGNTSSCLNLYGCGRAANTMYTVNAYSIINIFGQYEKYTIHSSSLGTINNYGKLTQVYNFVVYSTLNIYGGVDFYQSNTYSGFLVGSSAILKFISSYMNQTNNGDNTEPHVRINAGGTLILDNSKFIQSNSNNTQAVIRFNGAGTLELIGTSEISAAGTYSIQVNSTFLATIINKGKLFVNKPTNVLGTYTETMPGEGGVISI